MNSHKRILAKEGPDRDLLIESLLDKNIHEEAAKNHAHETARSIIEYIYHPVMEYLANVLNIATSLVTEQDWFTIISGQKSAQPVNEVDTKIPEYPQEIDAIEEAVGGNGNAASRRRRRTSHDSADSGSHIHPHRDGTSSTPNTFPAPSDPNIGVSESGLDTVQNQEHGEHGVVNTSFQHAQVSSTRQSRHTWEESRGCSHQSFNGTSKDPPRLSIESQSSNTLSSTTNLSGHQLPSILATFHGYDHPSKVGLSHQVFSHVSDSSLTSINNTSVTQSLPILLYALGRSEIRQDVLFHGLLQQKRWNSDGRVHEVSLQDAGFNSQIVQLFSSRHVLENTINSCSQLGLITLSKSCDNSLAYSISGRSRQMISQYFDNGELDLLGLTFTTHIYPQDEILEPS